MSTESQARRPSGLPQEVADQFRQMGREQAVWTPAALDDLRRVVDAAPVEFGDHEQQTNVA